MNRVTIRMPRELRQLLHMIATSNGTTVSRLIRRIVETSITESDVGRAILTESLLERILIALLNIETMCAQMYDPQPRSAERAEEIRKSLLKVQDWTNGKVNLLLRTQPSRQLQEPATVH